MSLVCCPLTKLDPANQLSWAINCGPADSKEDEGGKTGKD